MSAVAYIASSIHNTNDGLIGILVAIDTKPIDKLDTIQPILEIFAARAGSELERINATKHIRQKVVVEGVETREQIDILKRLSCKEFQGYYISRPLTANTFEKCAKKQFSHNKVLDTTD